MKEGCLPQWLWSQAFENEPLDERELLDVKKVLVVRTKRRTVLAG